MSDAASGSPCSWCLAMNASNSGLDSVRWANTRVRRPALAKRDDWAKTDSPPGPERKNLQTMSSAPFK